MKNLFKDVALTVIAGWIVTHGLLVMPSVHDAFALFAGFSVWTLGALRILGNHEERQ